MFFNIKYKVTESSKVIKEGSQRVNGRDAISAGGKVYRRLEKEFPNYMITIEPEK